MMLVYDFLRFELRSIIRFASKCDVVKRHLLVYLAVQCHLLVALLEPQDYEVGFGPSRKRFVDC